MAAGVARIDALGLTLRDIEHGLVDFPALVAGRQVWLCWQRGETADRLLARPRDRVLRTAAAGRAGMTERSVVVGRDGRAKAYRPLPDADRAAALASGLAAYERGDFFEAHEDLEPAWMGTDDRAERALLQGLIKVAAAYVHDVRGNPAGIARNLEGARALLARGRRRTVRPVNVARLDIDDLLDGDRPPPGRPRRASRRPDPRSARSCEGAPDEPTRDPDDRCRRGGATAARGSGRADPARRARGRTSSRRSGRPAPSSSRPRCS